MVANFELEVSELNNSRGRSTMDGCSFEGPDGRPMDGGLPFGAIPTNSCHKPINHANG